MGPNREAMEKTIRSLDEMGRLEDIDAARVQALLSMADALDAKPWNSQMWREYREALEALEDDDSDSGALEALFSELSAPVRDPET